MDDLDSSRRRAGGEYANRSVLIGADLLRTISRLGGGATLQEIADASGMLAARTHRYLLSLVKSGLLDHDPVTGRYDLGGLVLELGIAALGRLDGVRLGSDAIRRLSERLDMVAMLSVWGSNGATIVKSQMTRTDHIAYLREGRNLPLLTSATGRVFLAYLPSSETRAMLEAQASADQPVPAAEIESLCDEVRARGLARNAGISRRDALAAPVFDFQGRLAMVITIIVGAGTQGMEIDGANAEALRATAEALSRQLGARVGHEPPRRAGAALG
ncbi:MAG TPA: IclR family transcriptional regulator [Alphaproteobacteria bacterium]|jgi:DNA-binding IclR family transcriptional regulator|nr:IclR family transcriptional regulator [Alphaproteobacteria bacterium]